MSQWFEFYKNRLNERYETHINQQYKTFIDQVADSIKELGHKPVVVELGSGLGNITKSLLKNDDCDGSRHIIVDNDPEMLALAKMNLKNYDSHVDYILADIREMKLDNIADIVHSHGVLEHFCDNDIKRILSVSSSANHIHYVPSYKYKNPSFGDERLMGWEDWHRLTGLSVLEFNNGYDYVLINNTESNHLEEK